MRSAHAEKILQDLGKELLLGHAFHNFYDHGNQILYNHCAEYPLHQIADIIVTKTLFIGRIYAAALERIPTKKDLNQKLKDFYPEVVVPKFRSSKIDTYIESLRKETVVCADNIAEILNLHNYLLKLTADISINEKRSFCSKYLHFHLPHLYYLYDTRTNKKLGELKIRPSQVSKELKKVIQNLNISRDYDLKYKNHVLKCLSMTEMIKEVTNEEIVTPRHLDNILLHGIVTSQP